MAKAHLTPDGWRCEKQKEHLYRAKWMDYRSPSIQLLTMVTSDRLPLLGELQGQHIALTPLGQKVAEEIERIPTYKGASSIEIYNYVIMPDHIHILLRIHDRLPKHLGQYIRWFKLQCCDAYQALAASHPTLATPHTSARSALAAVHTSARSALAATHTSARSALAATHTATHPALAATHTSARPALAATHTSARPVLAAVHTSARPALAAVHTSARPALAAVPASIPSASHTPASNTPCLFAKEYHDRILTGKNQLTHMVRYIQDNPRRLALKRANRDLFRIRQNVTIGNIACTTLGNMFLAEYPQRQVLQCSRRLTHDQITTLKEECLAAASNGIVFITAAISEGEKLISRALREAGYPLIILLEQGFPEPDSPHYRYFKPQGVYFEACAAGKLLLVEPSAEVLEHPDIASRVIAKTGHIPHSTQRYRFVAMNVIAEWMCDDGC